MKLLIVLIGILNIGYQVYCDYAYSKLIFTPDFEKYRPSILNCSEEYFVHKNPDHFQFTKDSTIGPFKQRYFVCYNENYKDNDNSGLPTLFYFDLGNEDDVSLYVNNTGFMWDLLYKLPARRLIFAEHRFYGKSIPTRPGKTECDNLNLFTTEQALMDFASLLTYLNTKKPVPSATIGFGGSYGGMMAYWFRLKYPHLIDGVISASAPVMAFYGIGEPAYDDGRFAEIVTLDASESRGCDPKCVPKFKEAMKNAWDVASKTESGRKQLTKAFRLCRPLKSEDEAHEAVQQITDPWNYYAMGSYPFPSSYMVHGERDLPPFPIREACKRLINSNDPYDGLFNAAEMFLNTSQSSDKYPCVSLPSSSDLKKLKITGTRLYHKRLITKNIQTCKGEWNYQWCSEMIMPSSQGNEGRDMFWPPSSFNLTENKLFCEKMFGVISQENYVAIQYGGWKGLRSVSNVIFSNGLLDPWNAGGVLDTKSIPGIDPSVISIVIPNGGHHTDLMFPHPMDTKDIRDARFLEEKHIRKWVHEASKTNLNYVVRNDNGQISIIEA